MPWFGALLFYLTVSHITSILTLNQIFNIISVPVSCFQWLAFHQISTGPRAGRYRTTGLVKKNQWDLHWMSAFGRLLMKVPLSLFGCWMSEKYISIKWLLSCLSQSAHYMNLCKMLYMYIYLIVVMFISVAHMWLSWDLGISLYYIAANYMDCMENSNLIFLLWIHWKWHVFKEHTGNARYPYFNYNQSLSGNIHSKLNA